MTINIVIIALLIVVILILIFLVRNNRLSSENKLSVSSNNPTKPLNISLKEIDVTDLMENGNLLQSISDNKLSELNSMLPEGMNGIIQSVRYLSSKNEYLVEFSKKGQKMLNAGGAKFAKKGKELIPELKINGKYFEHGKLVGKGKKTLEVMTKISAIAISTAHIISGADIAKKLKVIDKKLDLILADRTNELYAELESILKYANEAKLINDTSYTLEELRRISKDIYRFRSRWRLRLESELKRIDNLHKGLLEDYFGIGKNRKDSDLMNQLSQFEEELKMIDASLALQLVIAEERGELELFQKEILPQEIKQLEKTKILFKEKINYISEDFEKESITRNELLEPMKNMIRKYDQLSMSDLEVQEIEVERTNLIDK